MTPCPPRIDLHRHLDGNIRPATVLELADQNGIRLPASTLEDLLPHVTVTSPHPGLVEFLEKFRWPMAVLASPADCRRVAYENVADARGEGLDGVELRFSPAFMASAHRLDPAEVVEAVADGVAAGTRDFGVPAILIGILSRTFGPAACMAELAALESSRDRITGIDLAGDEAGFPARLFEEHFCRARDTGWRVTVHAGEAAGPGSVWDALALLGAERIGHGVAAAGDPCLLEELARRGTTIECCLTSNVQTSTVASLDSHPIRQFLELGLAATINTDDPAISAIDFHHEIESAAPAAGLSPAAIHTALANAARATWIPGFA